MKQTLVFIFSLLLGLFLVSISFEKGNNISLEDSREKDLVFATFLENNFSLDHEGDFFRKNLSDFDFLYAYTDIAPSEIKFSEAENRSVIILPKGIYIFSLFHPIKNYTIYDESRSSRVRVLSQGIFLYIVKDDKIVVYSLNSILDYDFQYLDTEKKNQTATSMRVFPMMRLSNTIRKNQALLNFDFLALKNSIYSNISMVSVRNPNFLKEIFSGFSSLEANSIFFTSVLRDIYNIHSKYRQEFNNINVSIYSVSGSEEISKRYYDKWEFIVNKMKMEVFLKNEFLSELHRIIEDRGNNMFSFKKIINIYNNISSLNREASKELRDIVLSDYVLYSAFFLEKNDELLFFWEDTFSRFMEIFFNLEKNSNFHQLYEAFLIYTEPYMYDGSFGQKVKKSEIDFLAFFSMYLHDFLKKHEDDIISETMGTDFISSVEMFWNFMTLYLQDYQIPDTGTYYLLGNYLDLSRIYIDAVMHSSEKKYSFSDKKNIFRTVIQSTYNILTQIHNIIQKDFFKDENLLLRDKYYIQGEVLFPEGYTDSIYMLMDKNQQGKIVDFKDVIEGYFVTISNGLEESRQIRENLGFSKIWRSLDKKYTDLLEDFEYTACILDGYERKSVDPHKLCK